LPESPLAGRDDYSSAPKEAAVNAEKREHLIDQVKKTWKSASYSDRVIMKHALESYVGPDTTSIIDALSKLSDDELQTYYDDTVYNWGLKTE
jgi:hypothetical protein